MADLEESVSTFRLIRGFVPFKLNWCNCLLLATTLFVIVILLYECKDYVKAILLWVESQEHWLICIIFLVMFTLVSFPFTWGYTFLVVASGYLFGVQRGLMTVVITGNLGVAIAHYAMRTFNKKFPILRLYNSDKMNAILMVVSGSRAFKVAMFARLTPIPFGLQNTVFAVSNIGSKEYLIATFIGLFPAQIINVYLGSTLRSMEEVLSNKSTAATGFIVFFQIVVGLSLMMYVIVKARGELRKALNTDIPQQNHKISHTLLDV
ncbi:hypothetical protein L9F63_007211 [Diploptera punctata]|uniref:VTT domain-containing protein n=1 Tax=Diploptera punctata TaxID=6984 RepID=A0AAD7Z894_DIPPU|nr:hypothetical protein L9F63_007211 [Diploptera punctata]